jgi:hypothetical protein
MHGIQNDLKCLCDLYASLELLKAFNVSLPEAVGLSKRCGVSNTTSACKGILFIFPSTEQAVK